MLNKKFPRLLPEPIGRNMRVADLIEGTFKAYNGGRLAEGCRLLTEKMLPGNGCVGMTLTGALTPAGLGRAAVAPLMKAGFRGLDRLDGRESLPRSALRPGHGAVRGLAIPE